MKAAHDPPSKKPWTALVLCALLLAANLFLFGPATIYHGNYEEFQGHLLGLLWVLLLPALAVAAVPLAVGALLSRGLFSGYVSVLLGVGFLTYLHGSLLVWDYGPLDGTDLNLASTWRGWVDAGLWLLVLSAALAFRSPIARRASSIAAVLLTLQLVATGVVAYGLNSARAGEGDRSIEPMPSELAVFSARENVVHLILDEFQSDLFAELVKEDRGLREAFDGFTFFKNATTPSAVTFLSVAASLSGREFRNETPISEYLNDSLSGWNLYAAASAQGWRVDVASGVWWNKPSPAMSTYYSVPKPYASVKEVLRAQGLLLADLSVFRQAPHFLKPWIYNSQSWLLSSLLRQAESERFGHFAHLAFLEDLSGALSLGAEQPAYKFIHLITPHSPLVAGADCEFAGEVLPISRANFKQQSRCTVERLSSFLRELKTRGIYDSTVIVIHGDHGSGTSFSMEDRDGRQIDSLESSPPLWGAPLPLLLVKPQNAHDPLQVSNAPVELTDIPATLTELLGWESGFAGRSMFEVREDEKRDRSYYWSAVHRTDAFAKDFFDSLQEYSISGDPFKVASWSLGELLRSNVLGEHNEYVWNTTIEFGVDGTSKPFQVSGWGAGQRPFLTWAGGEVATLRIPLEGPREPVTLEASVKALLAEGDLSSQRVEIFVNQRPVGNWLVTQEGFHTERLTIAPEAFGEEAEIELSFRFPDRRSAADTGVNADTRPFGLAFHSILLRQE